MNTTPTKRPGVAVNIVKGAHRDKPAVIQRTCNHSWFEVLIAGSQRATLHTSYIEVAADAGPPADPLAHLM